MKKLAPKKLSLASETVRSLRTDDLRRAAGAVGSLNYGVVCGSGHATCGSCSCDTQQE